jgi:hypothetical protein
MDDKQFEKMFNDEEGVEFNNACHKRLLLDAVSKRMDSITELFNASTRYLTEANMEDSKGLITPASVKKIESFVKYLTKQAEVSTNQMDYLISRLIDDVDPDTEETENDQPT